MYIDFNAGNKAYKLRLNIKNTVALEKMINCNPLMIFGNGDRLPTISEMVYILHFSLQQYQHGITVNDTQEIFEEWLNDGNTPTDFIQIIIDIYRASGIISQESNEKN